MTLLHLGNNPYHLWVARRLRRRGGVVVLHDTVLHHLLVEEAAADGDWERFGRRWRESHGAGGAALAAARAWGIRGRLDPFLLPGPQRLACGRRRRVIVHNRRPKRTWRRACPGLPVRRVPLAVAALPRRGPSARGARAWAWRMASSCSSISVF